MNESNDNSLQAGSPPDLGKVSWGASEYNSRRYRDKATRSIAGWLILVFVAVVAGQYALVTWFTFADNADGLVQIEKVFNAVLPVVSGLVGAAATYYFTRERI